jgi:hypothetical protein
VMERLADAGVFLGVVSEVGQAARSAGSRAWFVCGTISGY